MARTRADLPAGTRITDYIRLGVLAQTFPVSLVQEILDRYGRVSRASLDGCTLDVADTTANPAAFGRPGAIRSLVHEAALNGNVDGDTRSFPHAPRVIRRKLPIWVALPPSGPRGLPPSGSR